MLSRVVDPSLVNRFSRSVVLRGIPLALAVLLSVALHAQEPAPSSDQQTIQMLLQRIDRLEARVAQLESARQGTAQPEPVRLEVAKAPAAPSSPIRRSRRQWWRRIW